MGHMAQSLVFGFAFVCIIQTTHGHALDSLGEEPTCISRFDYDFKMLKTMVDIAKENEELREAVAALSARVDQLTPAVQRPSDVAFYAQLSKSLDRIGNHHTIKFDHVTSNIGGAYDPESGIFEAPKGGTYVFHWVITNEAKSIMNTELYSNGNDYGKAMSDAMNHDDRAVAANLAVIQLEKGDQVWIRSGTWHSGKVQGEYYSTFSGYKLF